MANPKLIPVPFANTGTKTTIPVTRASNDAAEMPDYDGGFPPITSTPLAAGGKAPRRPDFNGILNDITANIRHLNSGGFFTFDAAFAAKIGGYPKGAVLLSNDGSKKYVSLIDGNTSDFNVSVDATKWAKTALTEREIQDIAWGTNTISAPWAPLGSPALTGMPTAPTASTGTRSTQLATTAFVGAECTLAAPVGSVYTFAGSTVPTGWLKCNGALLSRTTYAALFAVIGTTYGAGDGSTTFALPDLRGEFVRGADDGRGVDAGRVFGSAQSDAVQAWTATMTLQRAQVNGAESYGGAVSMGATSGSSVGPGAAWSASVMMIGPGVNSTARTAAESRPRNVAMHYIIKY